MKLAIFVLMILHWTRNFSKADLHDIAEDNFDIFSKCYAGLGCVDTDSKWYHKKFRPVNLRPLERHIIKTDILLIKPSKTEPESLQYNSLNAKSKTFGTSDFNTNADLVMMIHDFTSNGYTGWIKHLAEAIFLKSIDANVVSVDWQRGAEAPYDQAIANARVVALEIAAFIKEIHEKSKFNLDAVHLIGHGVGAHIAGYVGKSVKGIKKITGLDPDGPRFDGMPDLVKLSLGDAKYVEILHTDAYSSRSQGTKEKLGHSDFFINNAKHQLGCPENNSYSDLIYLKRNELKEGEILPGCSHKRAFKYFIESLMNKNCTFIGLKCDSYENFLLGKCTNCGETEGDCRTFGNKVYKPLGQKVSYFLNVADKAPFCTYQYKVTIMVLSTHSPLGYFDFILVDENSKATEATLATQDNYRTINEGNNVFVYYANLPKLDKIKEGKLRWNEHKKIYCFIYCKQFISVEKVVLEPLEIGVKIKKDETIVLCPADGNNDIDNGSYKALKSCDHKTSTSAMTTAAGTTAKVSSSTSTTKTSTSTKNTSK